MYQADIKLKSDPTKILATCLKPVEVYRAQVDKPDKNKDIEFLGPPVSDDWNEENVIDVWNDNTLWQPLQTRSLVR